MREKLSRFMYGRYGMDNLNYFIWTIAIALMLINIFTKKTILNAVIWIFLIFLFYRMLSRNTSARSRENDGFVRFLDKMPSWFPKFNGRESGYDQYSGYNGYGSYGNNDRSSYGSGYTQTKQAPKDKTKKVFKCPSCKQKVRVPKGKGKIMITCPKCGNQFQKRT